MKKTKYLVLSDCKENRRHATFKRAKQDHDKRLLSGKDDGIQLWREYKTYDHLILTDGGRNVKNENIKSYNDLIINPYNLGKLRVDYESF